MKKNLLLFALLAIISFSFSCKEEDDNMPPVMSDFKISPSAPSATDQVTVSVKVTDINGISAVKLYYKIGTAAYTSVAMTNANGVYSAVIPTQTKDTEVSYYVEATNTSQLSAVLPLTAPATAASYKVGAPSIVINEVFSRGVAGDLDWIEIYNNSDVAVNISGYKIYDAGGKDGSKAKMLIPANTTLAAKGFLAVVVDDATTANPTGSNFGISSSGEPVWLESATGVVIDEVTVPAMAVATSSYGRKPDGSATFVIFSAVTKGATNNNSGTLK